MAENRHRRRRPWWRSPGTTPAETQKPRFSFKRVRHKSCGFAHLPRACRSAAVRRFSSPARTPRVRPCCGRPSSFRRVRRAAGKKHRFARYRPATPGWQTVGRDSRTERSRRSGRDIFRRPRKFALSTTDGRTVFTRAIPDATLTAVACVIGATTADDNAAAVLPRNGEQRAANRIDCLRNPPVKRRNHMEQRTARGSYYFSTRTNGLARGKSRTVRLYCNRAVLKGKNQ